jgi:monoamine oxidase
MVKGGGVERYWTDSEVYRCASGNASLAVALARAIGAERIHLGRPVVLVRSRERSTLVISVDGGAWEADTVVVAVAPTVWERILFEPALPASLRPQLGLAVKYLAAVDERYWRAYGSSAEGVSDGEVSLTWDATEGQAGDDRAALVAFSGGPPAAACRARSGEAQRLAYEVELEKLLPGFAAHVQTTRMYDWPGDAWTRCGYAFPAPGEVTRVAPLLRRGIGRVRFAGEHVSSKFPGYMEGALESGVSVARRILAGERTEVERA